MQLITTFEESLSTNDGKVEPVSNSVGPQPTASVIYTNANRTLKALERISELVMPVCGRVEVVALQIVPAQLSLDRPPVQFELAIRRFRELAEQLPMDICIHAYLCREPWEALQKVLSPSVPIAIAVKKRWWPTREERLARRLRRAGFQVISVETA